jgi:hypothetical protein
MSDIADDDVQIGPRAPGVNTLTSLTRQTWNDPATKTKDGLLHILDQSFSDYNEIELTQAESEKLSATLKRLSTGASSFALLNCQGNECPFASRCPLVQMSKTPDRPHGKAPVNQDCLLEATLLRDSATSYIQEYQVDPVNFTEVNIVTELAEIEVLLWRINMQLGVGENALLVINQTVGFDRQTGQPITQQQVSPLFEQKQKLAARKSKLTKLMVGDRQEKYKKEAALKQKPDADASSQMSDVKKQLQALQTKLANQARTTDPSTIIDAETISPEDFMSSEVDKT